MCTDPAPCVTYGSCPHPLTHTHALHVIGFCFFVMDGHRPVGWRGTDVGNSVTRAGGSPTDSSSRVTHHGLVGGGVTEGTVLFFCCKYQPCLGALIVKSCLPTLCWPVALCIAPNVHFPRIPVARCADGRQ